MRDDLTQALIWFIGCSSCIGLWGLSIAGVFWDLKRRALPQREEMAWLALVGLMPGWGLLGYLLARLLALVFAPPADGPANDGLPVDATSNGAAPGAQKRVTRLKPMPAAPPKTGTIPAADLLKQTVPNPSLIQPKQIKLVVVAGPHAGDEFMVETLPARLGRGNEATLRLDRDLGISRQHAEIYWQAGTLRLRDLRSSHGTAVNGFNVEDKALELGDKIELGQSALIVKGMDE